MPAATGGLSRSRAATGLRPRPRRRRRGAAAVPELPQGAPADGPPTDRPALGVVLDPDPPGDDQET